MRMYARIVDDKVVEMFDLDVHHPLATDMTGMFPPSMVWMQAPTGCAEGWLLFNGALIAPNDLGYMLKLIDDAAGEARAKYITVAAGQESTYWMKAQDSAAYKAAGYSGPVPLMVAAEAAATGTTPQASADAILAQQALWDQKAAQIEQTRRTWKIALASSTDRLTDTKSAVAALGAL